MFATLVWSTWTTNSLVDIQEMCKIKCYNPIQSACNTVINLAYIPTTWNHMYGRMHIDTVKEREAVAWPQSPTQVQGEKLYSLF